MFSQLRSFNVSYLLPYRSDANAMEDAKAKGNYLHKTMLVGEGERAIIAQIVAMGGIPVTVEVLKPRRTLFSPLNREYKEQFLTSVYFNCSVMSAAKALEAVIESDISPLRHLLNPALVIIKSGGTFVEALEAIGAFDESTLAILEAGERTGSLKASIQTAVEHIRSSAMSNKLLMGIAAALPFEIFVAVSSLFSNRYVLLPKMAENMPENATPEKIEEIKAAIAHAYMFNDAMIVGTVVLFFVAAMATYAYFDKDQRIRKWIDDQVMKVPILSKAILHSAVANSFKVGASLVGGGVHLAVAMTITVKSSRVPGVMGYWTEAIARAESGDSIASALSQPILDNSERLTISSHTNAAQLAHAFSLIAERRTGLARKAATSFIKISIGATIAYSILVVLTSLYLLWIMNSSLMSGLAG